MNSDSKQKTAKKVKISSFAQKVYDKLIEVPKGFVTTYKDLAYAIGCRAYRAVGTAMNKNPYAPQVPCHRVIASSGKIGGFAYGEHAKEELLRKEGIKVKDGKIIDFKKKRWVFKNK